MNNLTFPFRKKHLFLLFFISLSGLFHTGIRAQAGDDYALIYIMRPKGFGSNSTNYRVHFNDRMIHNFEGGSRLQYKIFSEGELKVIVSSVFLGNTTPGESTFNLNVENGKEYYLKVISKDVSWLSNDEGKILFNNTSLYKHDLEKREEDKIVPILTLHAPKQKVTVEAEPVYRGSGDPLKGLNVSKAKEMIVGDYHALIIGIDNYTGTWNPLNNAVNDAKSIEQTLRLNYKFDNFKTLYNVQATRKNIINELEWLVHHAKEKDNVFIYYSGHGQFKQELNKGYWVPIDATTNSTSDYISNSDIQTYLGGIKAKHTLLISDACFSGDIFRGATVSVPFEDTDKYFMTVHNLTSRQAMTSGGIEPVMDGGRDGHSVFAYYLLKTLMTNDSKYYDASQLFETLRIPVINNSEQAPKFSAIKNTGDEGGQFIFIKK